MTLKVIQLMQADLSNAIRRTFVRHLARFYLTRGPSAIAELLVLDVFIRSVPAVHGRLQTAIHPSITKLWRPQCVGSSLVATYSSSVKTKVGPNNTNIV